MQQAEAGAGQVRTEAGVAWTYGGIVTRQVPVNAAAVKIGPHQSAAICSARRLAVWPSALISRQQQHTAMQRSAAQVKSVCYCTCHAVEVVIAV